MNCFVGIDLGSTTTKAVVVDETGRVVGRGITNSRSNYALAARVVKSEAFHDARFQMLRDALSRRVSAELAEQALARLTAAYRLESHLLHLDRLQVHVDEEVAVRKDAAGFDLPGVIAEMFHRIRRETVDSFNEDARRLSDFFRDLASASWSRQSDRFAREERVPFATLMTVFDKAILRVENEVIEQGFEQTVGLAVERLSRSGDDVGTLREAVAEATAHAFVEAALIGTGYGRLRLPFPPTAIRSEILCHGYGAHAMYPDTRTVLDIGGQDTKAIQVDGNGVVTSFQMNDRCAAGCGRYLGYIADEMNLGLHELGPLAMDAKRTPRINSTCTVFAGAELRNRLLGGESREDILSGLHRAIILRAMSLLARSGGIENQFTFTGGVAKNVAAVRALRQVVDENYGTDIILNINPNSIYTGALGAALFARDEHHHGATREASA